MDSKRSNGSPVSNPTGNGPSKANGLANGPGSRSSSIGPKFGPNTGPNTSPRVSPAAETSAINPFEEAAREAEGLPPTPELVRDPRLTQMAGGQIPDDLCPHPDRPIPTGYPNLSTLKTMSGRPPAAAKSMGRFRGLGVLQFLLLASATGLVTFGLGSGLALLKPLPGDSMPPAEQALRGLGQSSRAIQSLPRQWATGWAQQFQSKPVGIAAAPLEPAQRAELETDLAQLQTEMRTLANRLDAIEARLGYRYDGPLADRLLRATQILQDRKIDGTQPLNVTLPTDNLFEDAESALKPGAALVLDRLVTELQPYNQGLVTVAAHTDNIGPAEANRELSLRRAQSVMAYLRNHQNRSLQWMALGQGASQPIAKGSDQVSQQRNRRLEIRVDPR